jgi:hypothetical protein
MDRPPGFRQRSPEARALCRDHYGTAGPKLDPCATCPIMSACHKPTGPGLGAFNAWIDNINNAAQEHCQ